MKCIRVLLLGWGIVSLILCFGLCVGDILQTQWADEIGLGGYLHVRRFITVFELTLCFGAVAVMIMLPAMTVVDNFLYRNWHYMDDTIKVNDY
jgi:hypothetical protein